jgi:hypothetical protein
VRSLKLLFWLLLAGGLPFLARGATEIPTTLDRYVADCARVRSPFCAAASRVAASWPGAATWSHITPEITVDYLHLPALRVERKLLVFVTGAPAGTVPADALLLVLGDLAPGLEREETGYLLVHGLSHTVASPRRSLSKLPQMAGFLTHLSTVMGGYSDTILLDLHECPSDAGLHLVPASGEPRDRALLASSFDRQLASDLRGGPHGTAACELASALAPLRHGDQQLAALTLSLGTRPDAGSPADAAGRRALLWRFRLLIERLLLRFQSNHGGH